MASVGENLTAKYYVDTTISKSVDASSLLGLDLNEEIKLDEQGFTIPICTFNITKNDEINTDQGLC